MAINFKTEAAAAPTYPAQRFNPRERKVLESVDTFLTANASAAADSATAASLKVAKVSYSFASNGSDTSIPLGTSLPSGAQVVQVIEKITTDLASTSGTTTFRLSFPTDGNLTAAVTADGSNAANTLQDALVATTAAREFTAVASVDDITAGAVTWYVLYI